MSRAKPGCQRESQQQHIGNDETEGEDLGSRQTAEQQELREHKGGAPDGHHQKGHGMIDPAVLSFHHMLMDFAADGQPRRGEWQLRQKH